MTQQLNGSNPTWIRGMASSIGRSSTSRNTVGLFIVFMLMMVFISNQFEASTLGLWSLKRVDDPPAIILPLIPKPLIDAFNSTFTQQRKYRKIQISDVINCHLTFRCSH